MSKSSDFNVKRLLVVVLMTASVEGVQFDCDFQMATPWNVLGSRYTCYLPTVTNSGSTSLESVTGNHMTGKNNDDVGFLYIYNQNLPFVPENLASFFKNLDVLAIHSSALTSISAEDLRPFPGLLLLSLLGNRLTSIDGDLFKYTPHLQFVEFGHNQIIHIGHNLVTNLNNLTNLHFNSNVCIDQWAGSRAAVLSLAPQLSVLCPPLETTTTTMIPTTMIPTTTTSQPTTTTTKPTTTTEKTTTFTTTTTAIPINQCFCIEEIQELRELNRALEVKVDILQDSNVEQDRKIEQLQSSNNQLGEENQQQRIDIEQQARAIEEQNQEIERQSEEISKLVHENSEFAERLLEVEKKLRELGSGPSK